MNNSRARFFILCLRNPHLRQRTNASYHLVEDDVEKGAISWLELTCWNVLSEAKIEPPIQTLYFLSGGATTFIFMLLGANAVISLLIRSAMPGNIVEPPLRTMFPYKSRRISTSHFMMDWYVVSWIPGDSIPMREGWKSTSGQRNRSAPMVMTCPSGSS